MFRRLTLADFNGDPVYAEDHHGYMMRMVNARYDALNEVAWLTNVERIEAHLSFSLEVLPEVFGMNTLEKDWAFPDAADPSLWISELENLCSELREELKAAYDATGPHDYKSELEDWDNPKKYFDRRYTSMRVLMGEWIKNPKEVNHWHDILARRETLCEGVWAKYFGHPKNQDEVGKSENNPQKA